MSESSTTEPVQDQEFSSCSKKIKLERDTDSEVTDCIGTATIEVKKESKTGDLPDGIKNELEDKNGKNGTQKDHKEPSDAAAGAIENAAGAETEDLYAYLHRPNFSSENFKIEIMNLPKYYGAGGLKKFLSKLGVNLHKMKMMGRYVFATFTCEEERQEAMLKIKGSVFKGKTLDVKEAKPMQDPIARKRKAEAENNSQAKKENEVELTIEEQITKKTVPWAGKPYSEQLELKKNELYETLKKMTSEIRINNPKFDEFIKKKEEANNNLICPFPDVVPSPLTEKYRNKCEFTVGNNPETNEITVGFRAMSYKEGSCVVGPISHISFIPDAMKSVVRAFEAYFRASGRPAFRPEDHSGFWRQVMLRSNLNGEVLAVVTVNKQQEVLTADETDAIKNGLIAVAANTPVVSLYYENFKQKRSFDELPQLEHLFGSTHLREKMCGLEFDISPLSFFQINTLAAEVLYGKVGELAAIDDSTGTVLDVCCGTGTIGLSLAKRCNSVVGVEIIPSAIADAGKNAEINGITNCKFVVGKAEEKLYEIINTHSKHGKIVAIVDPPRAGLHQKACKSIRGADKIERVVYVACNAALAMKSFVDLCRTESKAYTGTPFVPTQAIAIDLFPDTPHCELILVFERFRADL